MAQVTGICKLFVDGQLIRTKPGAKLNVGGVKRDAIVGHSVYGFSEEPVASTLDATVAHMGDTDVVELSTLTGQTLRFETDTGQVYTIKQAWTSEPCELSSGGDMSLKMMGEPAVKE